MVHGQAGEEGLEFAVATGADRARGRRLNSNQIKIREREEWLRAQKKRIERTTSTWARWRAARRGGCGRWREGGVRGSGFLDEAVGRGSGGVRPAGVASVRPWADGGKEVWRGRSFPDEAVVEADKGRPAAQFTRTRRRRCRHRWAPALLRAGSSGRFVYS
jgi:hypothetical protein